MINISSRLRLHFYNTEIQAVRILDVIIKFSRWITQEIIIQLLLYKKKQLHKTLPAHQSQSDILTGHQHYGFSGRPLISNVDSIHLVGHKSIAGEQVITNKTKIKFEIVKNV